jgi:hypothetical protein
MGIGAAHMIGPIALIAPHALSGRFGRIAPGLLLQCF